MRLRDLVLAIAALLFAASLAAVIGGLPLFVPLIASGVILAGTLFERVRYGAASRRPHEPGWHATGERFIDDASGAPMTVWYNAATGERRYVLDDSRPS